MQKWVDYLKIRKKYWLAPILLLLLLMAMIVSTPGPETETGQIY